MTQDQARYQLKKRRKNGEKVGFKKGFSFWLGKKRDDKTKDKMRKSHLGKKLSENHKKNISKSLKGKIPKYIPMGWFKGKKFSEEHRKNISKSLMGKFGDKHSTWKGGKNLSYWKRAVKRRDGKCMKCGNIDKRVLTADHIKSKKMFPDLIYNVNNGITLCFNCHAIKTLEDKEYREWMNKKYWENHKGYEK